MVHIWFFLGARRNSSGLSIESRGTQIDICKNSWEHGWSFCNYGNSNLSTPRLTDKRRFIDVGKRWGLKLKKKKTAFALHEKTLSEDEMNNIDTARKRTVTSVIGV